MAHRILVIAVACLLAAAGVQAQTTPTGMIRGVVTDAQGGVLPGVGITASSPALQGTRTVVSSENGDYVIPFLPPGEYKVEYALSGFEKVEKRIRVQVAETVALDVRLGMAGLTEQVTVVADAPQDFNLAPTAAASYKAEVIDKLPVNRDIRGAVLLAPGTADTGPSGNITFSGAMSFEGLFLINGVVANETLRNQASLVFIEDAIEETKTSTAAISAEYGRFSGGVANVITKSGGNDFSGSVRVTFENDNWRTLTPFEKELDEDPRVDVVVPTYEATLGGPIFKDKLWFFGAARLKEDTASETTRFTNLVYDNIVDDKRFEGKLTWAVTPKHSFKGALTKREREETNNTFGTVMDRASFYDSGQPERLLSVNYTGILSSKFFVEAQFSQRKLSFVGSGARFTDIARGTMILDRSRGDARWNSPTFCAVCGLSEEDVAAGKLNEEKRNNRNVILKGSYFLSTSGFGSHSLVFGGDAFEDSRKNNNWQSGSEYRLFASDTIFRGEELFPVVRPGTSDRDTAASYILWTPIFESSVGSDLRTYSVFLNDAWRLNDRLSFNVGARWDKTDEKDQTGNKVADDQAISPRLAASFDPRGDGTWTFNAGFARYVIPVVSGIADLGSAGGRSASFQYVYRGPAINADPNVANPVSAHDALRMIFDWFNANGGTNRPLRSNPSYPGINRRIDGTLPSPSTWEYSLGLGRRLGDRGSFRIDGVYRNYDDFYTDKVTPGVYATDPAGRRFDLNLVVSTNDLDRRYKAILTQVQYRVRDDLTVGGNYTLSRSWGNVNGETSNSGPVQDDFLAYVEYKEPRWNTPTGDLAIDQRHKLRLWASWDRSLGRAGRISLGVLQRYSSGTPYSADANINTTSFVTNPGYLTPDTTITYYFGGRGAFKTDAVSATDLSLNYYLPVGFLKKGQLFARVIVDNLFDQSAQDGSGNETVFTASNQNPGRTMQPFNPFTTDPIEGVNYQLGPSFGQPISADDYQLPRTIQFAVGFRF
ncbi:MAG TPA: TonB-dependent receptor [Vicinamibacteria bacterium]|nr:TonB-dependent receptor [Vicinamibacteria bacterium]